MSNLNRAIILGRLGGDPEMKYLNSGQGVVTFSVATSKKWTDKANGQKHEKTAWHRCQAWGKTGELCHQYLKKGHLVYLEGEINYSESEKEGVKKYFTSIVVHQVQFLTPKDEAVPGPPKGAHPKDEWVDNSAYGGSNFNSPGPTPPPKSQSPYAHDEIPF